MSDTSNGLGSYAESDHGARSNDPVIEADVIVRYTIGTIEVRRTELHVPGGATLPVVGPDLAAVVEIRGTTCPPGP